MRRETRRTGRLVKMITVIDMKDFRWSDFDQRFLNALGKAEKVGELCYPQLLGLAVVVNALAIMSMLWGLAERVLPAATREKVRFCASRDTEAETRGALPVCRARWAPDALCDFLGGRAAPTGMLGSTPTPKARHPRCCVSSIPTDRSWHAVARALCQVSFFQPAWPSSRRMVVGFGLDLRLLCRWPRPWPRRLLGRQDRKDRFHLHPNAVAARQAQPHAARAVAARHLHGA